MAQGRVIVEAPVVAGDVAPLAKTATRTFAWHRNATFAALFVGYAAYYLCRSNLSCASEALKPVLGEHPDEAFAWIQSTGQGAYAIGKVLAGPVADSRGGRWVFFLGLAGSVVASLLFGLGGSLGFFLVAWGANLAFQSMGWGGLVNVLARWFPKSSYGTAMGAMSINYQAGGALALLLAAGLLQAGVGWPVLFAVPAVLLAVIGLVVNPFLTNDPRDVGHELPLDPDAAVPVSPEPATAVASRAAVTPPLERPSYVQSFLLVAKNPMFWVMVGLSFVLTLERKTFEIWTPKYFSDMGASASGAAFKSSVFPLLGCAGTFATGWLSDRFLSGRRTPVMAAWLVLLAGALVALGHTESVAGLTGVTVATTRVVLVGVTGFLLYGAYSVVGGVAALDFGGKRAAGTAAGILDGVGYAGAFLGGIGMAKVLAAWQWSGAFGILAVLSVVALALCRVLWRVKPSE